MNKKEVKDEQFELFRDNIFKELIRAENNLVIFIQLYQALDDYIRLPDKYKPYFNESMKAHYDVFVISIYNVTKEDKNTGNFKRLFKYIKSNKLSEMLDSNKLLQAENSFNSVREILDKLYIFRDQYIGHNQLRKHHNLSTVHEVRQLVELLNILENILRDLSLEYDGKDLITPDFPNSIISNIYQDLISKNQ